MRTTALVFLTALLAGCGGGGGQSDNPQTKKWRPPASEAVTDLHYGIAVYLPGLDEMMQLGPKARLTLCILRNQTNWIKVKRTSNPVKAGKSSRTVLDGKQLEQTLLEYGKRLRGEMTPEERARFEALVPSELYGVKVKEKDGAGIVNFNVKFETNMGDELKVPRENTIEVMNLDDVLELVTVKDRPTLEAVLDVLKHHAEVDDVHRDKVCQALAYLKDDQTSLFGTIHETFLRWCDESQVEHFRPLLLGGPKGATPHVETLLRYLEVDEANAIRFIVDEVPEKGQRHVLWSLSGKTPETARKVCYILLDKDVTNRRVGINFLGQCGTPEDIPRIVTAVEGCAEPRKISFDASNAFQSIKRRHPESEVEIPTFKHLKRK